MTGDERVTKHCVNAVCCMYGLRVQVEPVVEHCLGCGWLLDYDSLLDALGDLFGRRR